MIQNTDVSIRAIRPDEKKPVYALFCQAFPVFLRLFFSWGQHIFVAERNGELLGAIILGVFPISQSQKGGIVYWLFTGPKARGLGAGQRLVEAALDYFESQGCTDQFACVEGFNSSSSKNFSTRGFSILSLEDQIRRYGWKFLPIWFHTGHIFDIGHFLWGKPSADKASGPIIAWGWTALVNIVLVWLAFFRQSGWGRLSLTTILAVPISVLIFIGLRSLCMKWVSKRQGLDMQFRSWDTNIVVCLIVSLLPGGIFPNPGNFYPKRSDWRYREELPKLGKVALAGIMPTLLLCYAGWILQTKGGLSPEGVKMLRAAMSFGIPLAVFDAVFAFFPFVGFNSRRLWDWNKAIWAVVTAAALLLVVI